MAFRLEDAPNAYTDPWGAAKFLLQRRDATADSLPPSLDLIAKEFALARVLEYVLRISDAHGRDLGRAIRWIINTAEEMRQGMFNGAKTVFATFQPLKLHDETTFASLKIYICTFLALWESEVLIEGDFV